jgi:aspartyl/asparaginyl beta-hydroxylase (cupin superfamily)
MSMTAQEANQLVREGNAALQAGRAADARDMLERVTAAGFENAELWLLIAAVCRTLGDAAGEEAALDRALALDPRALRAILQKADCRLRAGDDSAAAMLYRKALMLAEGQNVPPQLVAELRRAETMMEELKARFTAHLEGALADLGFPAGHRSPRFEQSLDLRAGRKQVYLQEPTLYYFPELPQVQFFEPEDFAWAAEVEAATDVIRDELRAMLATGREGFLPYIRSEANQPREHPLLDRLDWSALFFCENGQRFPEVIASCPRTWEVMQRLPFPDIPRAGPSIMFSLLKPGTRIPAHNGTHNTRLICHLPLIVPPGCFFRVGNETRQWEVGKLIIFDDTIEHEAWNDSAEERVVLIFEVWRPELSAQEQSEVTALFAASQAQLERPQDG